jgi:hypothetical protein
MLSLPELSQTYKNSHPHYINPLANFDVTDHELANLKREALLPYLQVPRSGSFYLPDGRK